MEMAKHWKMITSNDFRRLSGGVKVEKHVTP